MRRKMTNRMKCVTRYGSSIRTPLLARPSHDRGMPDPPVTAACPGPCSSSDWDTCGHLRGCVAASLCPLIVVTRALAASQSHLCALLNTGTAPR